MKTRKELITEILTISSDEFETKQDILQLAYETRKELNKRLIYTKAFNR